MSFKKLSAIDIDGTLVNPKRMISDGNKAAIAKYIAAGGIIILASGRMHSSIRPFGIELNLPGDNIILSYNGGMAKTMSGTLLFERPVPANYGAEIVQFCKEHDLHLNYYYNDNLYVSKLNKWSDLYLRRSGSESIPVGDLSSVTEHPPTKLIIIGEKEMLDPLLVMFKAKYGSSLYITKTDDEYLEFMDAGVDKGSGLMWICEKLGIAENESAAFGDSFNDIQMIEWAGVGVAMSTGREAAKESADIVAENSQWTGVGDTLLRFLSN
jgi:Cof subfamily protein (haloacid dehalogenase superfamily)